MNAKANIARLLEMVRQAVADVSNAAKPVHANELFQAYYQAGMSYTGYKLVMACAVATGKVVRNGDYYRAATPEEIAAYDAETEKQLQEEMSHGRI